MIDAIANKYQFNIIRVFLPWDYYNPAPGEFHFDDLEELLGICDEYDMRVLMTVHQGITPYWLEQAHPETRYVNARGEAIHLGGSGGSYSGGWPGLCLDWEVVQEAAARFVHELAKVCVPHRSLYAYDVWNEPQIVRALATTDSMARPTEKLFCYCERTIAEFRSWLQRRYGSLDRLNQAWIRRYPNWKAIDPPRCPIQMYADWLDWRQFIQERTADYMKFWVKNVRDIDPDHIVETHINHFPPIQPATLTGVQGWRLAEPVQVFGLSFYPYWWDMPADKGTAALEITRSCAGGKDFWVTELQGGHANEGYWRSAPMRARDIRFWNWMSVAAGAKGIIYWAYVAEGTGREASGFGLVQRSGEPTERAEEAAKANRLIQAHWDILKDYRPKPQVAILFDQDNAILTFAMSAGEEPCTASAKGYYKAFWNLDLWVDFIEPASIENRQYKVIVAPWHLIGKQATCQALRRFVEGGGTLILETAFGMFDDSYYFNPVIPPYGLDEAFGYREKESVMIESGKLPLQALDKAEQGGQAYEADVEFWQPTRARVKAHTFLTPLETRTATPIAKCREWTVGATKRVGRGRVYYIGTNFGASIASGSLEGIELLRSIVSPVARPPVVTSGELRSRLIEGAAYSLLTVFNSGAEDRTATLDLPARYHRATDIYSGRVRSVQQARLGVTVPFQDVVVLKLE
jgi:beta-galactosidase